MIEFLDGAMAAYLSQMFNSFVVWGPPDLARKYLARKSQERGRNDIGLPGMTVFRTACPRYADVDFSQTIGALGLPAGKTNAGDFAISKIIRVQPEYTVQIWTADMSDRNMIERELQFFPIGHPVDVTIRCQNYEGEKVEVPLKFACELMDDPTYQYEEDKETGILNYFGLQTKFYVDSFWHKSDLILRIEEIDILYQSALNTDPVTYQELDFVQILPGSFPA